MHILEILLMIRTLIFAIGFEVTQFSCKDNFVLCNIILFGILFNK